MPKHATAARPASTRTIRMSDVGRCPKRSLLVAHYKPDGTCLCREAPARRAKAAELRAEARELYRQARELEHGL